MAHRVPEPKDRRQSINKAYEDLWNKKDLSPGQLLVHDVRIEERRNGAEPRLEVGERNASDLIPPAAALTSSSRLIKAAEAATNPIEYQTLTRLEEQWGWLSELRLKRRQIYVDDPADSAICRWIHVSSKVPEYLSGFLWAMSDLEVAKSIGASLRSLTQCVRKQERFSKHGRHFAPFCQSLYSGSNADSDIEKYPLLISVPFLDWSLHGQTPPLRFQVDKREGYVSSRAAAHPLRSILQHFYRLEETRDRERDQVFSRHRPWTSDRELDIRVRSWYGQYPTALNVDEVWILAIDPDHVVSFSSNQSWKSRYPPLQLSSRISDVSFRDFRATLGLFEDPQKYTALSHSIVCLHGALGMLHRGFWQDLILCLTDRYAGYLSHMQFRLHRSPSTRLVMDLLHLQEELNIVTKLMEQQLELLRNLSQMVGSSPHPAERPTSGTRARSNSVKLLPTQQNLVAPSQTDAIASLHDQLQAEVSDLQELRDNTNTLVNRTVQLVNIRLEDHGKAILVFTIVTMVFLPLNFVSSFFGMNFSDIRNLSATQGLFWIVGACVTVGVVSLSMFLAFYGNAIFESWLIWRDGRQRSSAEQASGHRSSGRTEGFRVLDVVKIRF